MGNFGLKVDKFVEIFIEQNGYVKVTEGLQNTVLIAIVGLIIGILIGTVIATVKVLPKYKMLPRVLNGICSFYVALFRGTPIVVQLLVGYYVLMPLLGSKLPGVQVSYDRIRNEQRRVYFGDHAKRYSVCGQRTNGSGTCSRFKFWDKHDKDRDTAGCKKYSSDVGK